MRQKINKQNLSRQVRFNYYLLLLTLPLMGFFYYIVSNLGYVTSGDSPSNIFNIDQASAAANSPLQSAGMVPVWQENFTNGYIDRMQYTWAKGTQSGLEAFVIPGSIYMGKQGTTNNVEQEVNNFKGSSSEAIVRTLEFDLFAPQNGTVRVSLRPRRIGDFAHIKVGQANNKTSISFKFLPAGQTISYATKTGPTLGWAHVISSYRQFTVNGVVKAEYVVAINNEIKSYMADSKNTNPIYDTYWANNVNADGWSIEVGDQDDATIGRYVGNIRGYNEFLTVADMQAKIAGGRVDGYLPTLSDPRNFAGVKHSVTQGYVIDTYKPNPIIYNDNSGLSVNLDGSITSAWNKITKYEWDFGDATAKSLGRKVNHVYSAPGTYNVSLTATSKDGTTTKTRQVVVN